MPILNVWNAFSLVKETPYGFFVLLQKIFMVGVAGSYFYSMSYPNRKSWVWEYLFLLF